MRLNCTISQHPACCGITLLTGLITTNERSHPANWYLHGRSAAVATTAHYQKDAEKELRRLGFKAIRKFRNENSGNIVRVWMYVAPSEKTKK